MSQAFRHSNHKQEGNGYRYKWLPKESGVPQEKVGVPSATRERKKHVLSNLCSGWGADICFKI